MSGRRVEMRTEFLALGEGKPATRELALVMGGGGARAAYQVGFLQSLARRHPRLAPPILTGVSAGAINAVYLASHASPFAEKVEALAREWSALTVDQIFRADTPSLARHVLRWGARLVLGRAAQRVRVHSLVDTEPLVRLLDRLCDARGEEIPGIERNLMAGRLRALAITASSYSTGQSITWVQGRGVDLWERSHRKAVAARICTRHVMASAALPLFFPAVRVDDGWYGDGGIRLTSPLSPAIHLGAGRILAISTRYHRSLAEADQKAIDDYPPPVQVMGVLMNAVFLDLFDADALRLQSINDLIRARPEAERQGLRPVEILVLRPSRDLGKLANEYEAELPKAFRFLTRGLGTQQTRSNDLLSLVMFQPNYVRALLELGERDAEARAAEIDAFLGTVAPRDEIAVKQA